MKQVTMSESVAILEFMKLNKNVLSYNVRKENTYGLGRAL